MQRAGVIGLIHFNTNIERFFQYFCFSFKSSTESVKALCLILDVYLVLLASFPCCSMDNCDSTAIGQHTGNSFGSHENDNSKNIYSPFFTCGSCPGFIVDFTTMVAQPLPNAIKKQKTPGIPDMLNDYFNDFWQPPKVS